MNTRFQGYQGAVSYLKYVEPLALIRGDCGRSRWRSNLLVELGGGHFP